jgi:hypothetical protein
MPWVGTELWVADIAADGALGATRMVAGGADESVVQPEWSPDGVLHFISDRSGWWNLYRADGDGIRALCPRAADFAQAPWMLAMSSYAFADPGHIVCSYWEHGIGRLAQLDPASLRLVPIDLPYTDYGSVHARPGEAVFRAASPTEGGSRSCASTFPQASRKSSGARRICFPNSDPISLVPNTFLSLQGMATKCMPSTTRRPTPISRHLPVPGHRWW